jgi:hypothetical protein
MQKKLILLTFLTVFLFAQLALADVYDVFAVQNFRQQSVAQSAPATGKCKWYFRAGVPYYRCAAGAEMAVTSGGYTSSDLGVTLQHYSANTMVSSATPTDAHITKFNAATGLYDDAGALVNTGTGVPAAAAINIGTAGSFVVNGGALGTPSSGNIGNTTGLKDQLSFTFDSGGAAVLATTQKPAKTYRSYAITSFDSWVIDCDLGNTDSTPIIINLAQKVRTAATSGAIPVIATNNMCATTYRPIGNSSTPIAQGAWACATTATAADTNFAAYIVQAPTTSTHCTLIVNVTR